MCTRTFFYIYSLAGEIFVYLTPFSNIFVEFFTIFICKYIEQDNSILMYYSRGGRNEGCYGKYKEDEINKAADTTLCPNKGVTRVPGTPTPRTQFVPLYMYWRARILDKKDKKMQ